MIHTIIKYLLISTTLFFCSCHKPKTDIITPAKQLIERQIGERAQSIHFEYIEPSDGKDIFEVIASDGRLTLRGSSSVAICYAFHTYMKEACKSMKTWSGEHIHINLLSVAHGRFSNNGMSQVFERTNG